MRSALWRAREWGRHPHVLVPADAGSGDTIAVRLRDEDGPPRELVFRRGVGLVREDDVVRIPDR
jgi:hypothetical protein